MLRNYSQDSRPADVTIERLRRELRAANTTIIDLMSDEIQKVLTSYHYCETSEATNTWENEVADALLKLCNPLPNDAPRYFSNRAWCPLCHRGSSSADAVGFALPDGLRRHLVGWGNVPRCDIMTATSSLAWESWQRRFEESDAAKAAEDKLRLRQRRDTETLYRLGPKEEPKLLDDCVGFAGNARDSASLLWAEQRLLKLGFEVATEDRVKSFTRTSKNHIVYANPLANGSISFWAHWVSPQKRVATRYATFELQDRWKHDLGMKYKTRLAEALRRLV